MSKKVYLVPNGVFDDDIYNHPSTEVTLSIVKAKSKSIAKNRVLLAYGETFREKVKFGRVRKLEKREVLDVELPGWEE